MTNVSTFYLYIASLTKDSQLIYANLKPEIIRIIFETGGFLKQTRVLTNVVLTET